MQVIRTKRCGSTNQKIQATNGDFTRYYSVDDSLPYLRGDDVQHMVAVTKFCTEFKWHGRYIGGTMATKGKFICMVWVCDDSADKHAMSPVVVIPKE